MSISVFIILCLVLKSTHISFSIFFSIWVFFHNHSRITGLQRKGEGISLTPHCHFHPLRIHLGISWAITAESSRLHIRSSRTRTGNLWSLSAIYPILGISNIPYFTLNVNLIPIFHLMPKILLPSL